MKNLLQTAIVYISLFTALSLNGLEELSEAQRVEYKTLLKQFKKATHDDKSISHSSVTLHQIAEISANKDRITLEDGSQWKIGWWYRPLNWSVGSKIYIQKGSGINDIAFQNIATGKSVHGTYESGPSKIPVIQKVSNNDDQLEVVLSNGTSFIIHENRSKWLLGHQVMIYQNSKDKFQLWNLNANILTSNCTLIDYENPLLSLEKHLSKKVVQQEEACKVVANAFLNVAAGLKPKEKPIGVFLFLGPTGVGKTELAKTLCQELNSNLIRFDMSHFTERHHADRLIGSPPGYVNHEEGGQLTNAIKKSPKSIVLLDEMEKAYPTIPKFFLPVFDEGYILDNKNKKIDCNQVVFIMTSNLCGMEIAEMFKAGVTPAEILETIEPTLMDSLSPEFYNRVRPILFRPLGREAMEKLIHVLLSRIISQIEEEKGIVLTIDSTVEEYLIAHGFHPTLGARPLQRLVDAKILTTLAYAIIKYGISSGNAITLYYDDINEFYINIES